MLFRQRQLEKISIFLEGWIFKPKDYYYSGLKLPLFMVQKLAFKKSKCTFLIMKL